MRAILVSILVLLLTSCTSYEIEDHSVQFNEASESLNLRLLLLNAVRASKDYPLQFSKIGNYQGVGSPSASISASIPWGPKLVNPIYEVNPSLALKSGVQQLSLVDLNTEEAQAALKRALTPNDFRYYYINREAREAYTIFDLTIQTVGIQEGLLAKMKVAFEQACANLKKTTASRHEHSELYCRGVRTILQQCPREELENKVAVGDQTFITFETSIGRSPCRDMSLRYVSFILQRLGFNIEARQRKRNNDKEAPVTPGGKDTYYFEINANSDSKSEGASRETTYEHIFSFTDPDVKKAAACPSGQRGSACENPKFYITFRSPESMVRYLGRIIAAQAYRDPPHVHKILSFECQGEVPMLEVTRGRGRSDKPAVSVRDQEGEDFYVPAPKHGDPCRAKSMETLSLAADILNGAVSKKAIPTVTSVNLLPAQ